MNKTILILLLLPYSIFAQEQSITSLSGKSLNTSMISQAVEDRMAALNVAGLSLAIIDEGKVGYAHHFGFRDFERQSPINDSTLFEAASITKPVFAWLVMKLVEKGIIDLDKPLHHYFDYPDINYDERHKKITARLVLSHQSGMPNWRRGRLSLNFDPGTDFSYSGEGFVYLGKAIEHLMKMPLEEIFQKEVFQPLEMHHSTLIWSPRVNTYKAAGHYNGNVYSEDLYRPLNANPAASLLTNTRDFSKFMLAVMNYSGLKKESYDEIFTTQVTPKEESGHQNDKGTLSWGLGWVLEQSPHGLKYQHGGNNNDFRCYFEMSVDKKKGYVFFSNSNRGANVNSMLNPLLTSGELVTEESKNLSADTQIDFSAGNWSLSGKYDHLNFKGKQALALVNNSEAVLNGKTYKNMIIEFDLALPRDYCNAGIKFRMADEDNYEHFYIRAHQSGTNQSMQYTPVFNGNSGWQLHSGYNYTGRRSHWRLEDWMHVRIAIFDDWMEVYVDDMERLVLHVFDLKHPIQAGKVGLWANAPAYFSNFRITAISEYDFYYDRKPKPQPSEGTITQWQVSNSFNAEALDVLHPSPQFLNALKWQNTSCEYNGLVNLSRVNTLTDSLNTVIAKVKIISDKKQIKRMQFGYSDIGKIFLNQSIIYDGQHMFRSRDPSYWGTIGYFESIYLHLDQGENELWFVVTENFGGWGMMAKLDDIEGIRIAE